MPFTRPATGCSPERCSACSWSSPSPCSTRRTCTASTSRRQRPRDRPAGLDLPAPGGAALLPRGRGGLHDAADDRLHAGRGRRCWPGASTSGPRSGRSAVMLAAVADDVPRSRASLAAQAPGLARPGHHADQLLVPLRPRHRHRRGRRGDHRARRACSYAGAGCAARCTSSPWRWRCSSGSDRIFLGVHNPSDVLAGYAVGAFWVLVGLRRLPPGAARQGPARRSAPRCRPPGSWRWSSTRSRSRTSPPSGRWSSAAPRRPAGRRRPGTPRPSRTRAARWPRTAAISGAELVHRLRRRRHRPHGVRRARRHRRLGRRRPGRHRQPAGPQPRHPALPAGRRRRGAQRPGPGHRPGQGLRRRASARTSTSW